MSNPTNETAAERAERTGALMDEWHAQEGDTYTDAPSVSTPTGITVGDVVYYAAYERYAVASISEDGDTANLRVLGRSNKGKGRNVAVSRLIRFTLENGEPQRAEFDGQRWVRTR